MTELDALSFVITLYPKPTIVNLASRRWSPTGYRFLPRGIVRAILQRVCAAAASGRNV